MCCDVLLGDEIKLTEETIASIHNAVTTIWEGLLSKKYTFFFFLNLFSIFFFFDASFLTKLLLLCNVFFVLFCCRFFFFFFFFLRVEEKKKKIRSKHNIIQGKPFLLDNQSIGSSQVNKFSITSENPTKTRVRLTINSQQSPVSYIITISVGVGLQKKKTKKGSDPRQSFSP